MFTTMHILTFTKLATYSVVKSNFSNFEVYIPLYFLGTPLLAVAFPHQRENVASIK